jgi:hypothetical protein
MPRPDFLSSCLEHPSTSELTFHSAYQSVPGTENDESFGMPENGGPVSRAVGHVHRLAELTLLQLQKEYEPENVRKLESSDGREIVLFIRSQTRP